MYFIAAQTLRWTTTSRLSTWPHKRDIWKYSNFSCSRQVVRCTSEQKTVWHPYMPPPKWDVSTVWNGWWVLCFTINIGLRFSDKSTAPQRYNYLECLILCVIIVCGRVNHIRRNKLIENKSFFFIIFLPI